MMGSIRWNLYLAVVGFVLTFVASYANNLFSTSLIRGLIGAGLLFLAGFVFRFVLGLAFGTGGDGTAETANAESRKAEEDEGKGTQLDYTTPDDQDQLHDLLKQGGGNPDRSGEQLPFQPLDPPKLKSIEHKPSEELARALRHMSDEQGG